MSTAVTLAQRLPQLKVRFEDLFGNKQEAVRFLRIVGLQFAKQPELQDCRPESVLASAVQCAKLGLDPGRTAHFVKFGKDCVLLTDIKGHIELAIRSRAMNNVSHFTTEVVFGGEPFEVERGTVNEIRHRPRYESRGDGKTSQDVAAVYAIVSYMGGAKDFEVMTVQQVEHVRSKSRAKDGGPWVSDWGEMARKTVLRRLLKRVPQSPEMAAAMEADDRYDLGHSTRSDTILDEDASAVGAQVAAATRSKLDELKKDVREGEAEDVTPDADQQAATDKDAESQRRSDLELDQKLAEEEAQ